MGDMSKCPHGGYVGYCDDCSPEWEMELIKADAADIIYMRGYNKGRTDQRENDASLSLRMGIDDLRRALHKGE